MNYLYSEGRFIIRDKETRLEYKDFTVVFFNFNGYDNSNPYEEFALDTTEFTFYESEGSIKKSDEYYEYYTIETLIAKKDTVNLYESWSRLESSDDDNVIGEDVPIQIIAKNKNDIFRRRSQSRK